MVDNRGAICADTSAGLLGEVEGRDELSGSKEDPRDGPVCQTDAQDDGSPLPPKTIPFRISSDWIIYINLRDDGRDTMTPITDIAELIKEGDIGHIAVHSVRDRMRFVDACVTDLVEAIHPFIGPRRIDAFYESKVPSNVPLALEAVRKMGIALQSLIGTPSPPPVEMGTRPRHFNKTYKNNPTTKRSK